MPRTMRDVRQGYNPWHSIEVQYMIEITWSLKVVQSRHCQKVRTGWFGDHHCIIHVQCTWKVSMPASDSFRCSLHVLHEHPKRSHNTISIKGGSPHVLLFVQPTIDTPHSSPANALLNLICELKSSQPARSLPPTLSIFCSSL
jgi:hypothetical protein